MDSKTRSTLLREQEKLEARRAAIKEQDNRREKSETYAFPVEEFAQIKARLAAIAKELAAG